MVGEENGVGSHCRQFGLGNTPGATTLDPVPFCLVRLVGVDPEFMKHAG
jgi:hypothetical protein